MQGHILDFFQTLRRDGEYDAALIEAAEFDTWKQWGKFVEKTQVNGLLVWEPRRGMGRRGQMYVAD